MTTRRGFLAGLMATGLAPKASWADAGDPAYLAAARLPDDSYVLQGLSEAGQIKFQIPIPARGHAAAAHPNRPLAVAFARRPGTFAVVIDCATGKPSARLEAPEGRHFYGHGAFSADGSLLFTSENDYDAAWGMVGVWDVASGYNRIDEFETGGTGPHELRLMPDGDTLVIANGGIETHPDSGRAKLNIPVMEPNLSYVSTAGVMLEQVELERALHRNSIRHLAVRDDGTVGFAMQWQGGREDNPPLLGLHKRGFDPVLLAGPADEHRQMQGYAGSVAMSRDGTQVAITSPRGGLVQMFDVEAARYAGSLQRADVCGVSDGPDGFLVTTGSGQVAGLGNGTPVWQRQHDCQWDNHLVRIR